MIGTLACPDPWPCHSRIAEIIVPNRIIGLFAWSTQGDRCQLVEIIAHLESDTDPSPQAWQHGQKSIGSIGSQATHPHRQFDQRAGFHEADRAGGCFPMLDGNFIDPSVDIDRLTFMASPCGMDHGLDQSRANLGRKWGIAQAFQGLKVHPVASVDGERNTDFVMHRRMAAPRARVVLHIVDDQGTRMQTFDRIADRGRYVANATPHLETDLKKGAADPFTLSAFEIAHWLKQRAIQELFHVRIHPGTLIG
jgi:hypothetical protein